jgi:hypothetical protein
MFRTALIAAPLQAKSRFCLIHLRICMCVYICIYTGFTDLVRARTAHCDVGRRGDARLTSDGAQSIGRSAVHKIPC